MKNEKEYVPNIQTGLNQIAQIFKEFEMGCDEAIIRREGKRLILEPKKRSSIAHKKMKILKSDLLHSDITLLRDFRL